MLVNVKCNYCGLDWEIRPRSQREIKEQYCKHCNSNDTTPSDITMEKADYYTGCTPFKFDQDIQQQGEIRDHDEDPYSDQYD